MIPLIALASLCISVGVAAIVVLWLESRSDDDAE